VSLWTPEWSISINGTGDVTGITLANLIITSGRTDIYSQPVAGYCSVEIINLNLTTFEIDVNDSIIIKVKDSTGTFVNLFGGDITDVETSVKTAGLGGVTESIRITALGALSKLPKTLTTGVLSKAYDGDQIYTVLSEVLFDQWNEVPAAETWAAYNPTTTWANAENSGLGEIDRAGDYELAARSSSVTDVYSLVSALATSGLGYLYEDSSGRIGYADSTHRSQYLSTYGYVDLNAGEALTSNLSIARRLGDIRNKVTITYKNGAQVTAEDAASIAVYGSQAQNIQTSIENAADAEDQADFYLAIRAYPQDEFKSITYQLGSPNIDNSDRDALLEVFMGLALNITNLPANLLGGSFQGFVEGWTFRAGYNSLEITLNLSPIAYSLQAFRWNNVPAVETWNTISPTLDWLNATIVA
jgi:hypothetical protein